MEFNQLITENNENNKRLLYNNDNNEIDCTPPTDQSSPQKKKSRIDCTSQALIIPDNLRKQSNLNNSMINDLYKSKFIVSF